MAIAYGASSYSVGSSWDGSGYTKTLSHTVGVDDNVLIVVVTIAGSAKTCTGVTYDGTGMTQDVLITHSGDNHKVYVFSLASPSTGANNIVATFDGAEIVSVAGMSFSGANTLNPVGATATKQGTGSSFSQALTTQNDNSFIISAFVQGGYGGTNSLTVTDVDQTVRWSTIGVQNGNRAGSSMPTTSSGSYTTGFGGVQNATYALAVVEINEDAPVSNTSNFFQLF